MSGYNCVTDTTLLSIKRAGYSDFKNDGQFDSGTETYNADLTNQVLENVLLKYQKIVASVCTEMTAGEKTTVDNAEELNHSAFPPGYVDGLIMSDNDDAKKDITVGHCRSDDNLGNIVLTSAVTCDVGSSGAINQLDTGTVAANTWYAVFAISDDVTGASLFSLSSTSPTLPSGYIYKRLIGWARTDGTSDFYKYTSTDTGRDRVFMLNEEETIAELLTNGAATTYTNVDLSSLVCPSSTLAYINSNHVSQDAGQEWATFRTAGLTGTSPTTNPYPHRTFGSSGNSAECAGSTCFWIRTDGTQNIEYANSSGSEETDVWVLGYKLSL